MAKPIATHVLLRRLEKAYTAKVAEVDDLKKEVAVLKQKLKAKDAIPKH